VECRKRNVDAEGKRGWRKAKNTDKKEGGMQSQGKNLRGKAGQPHNHKKEERPVTKENK